MTRFREICRKNAAKLRLCEALTPENLASMIMDDALFAIILIAGLEKQLEKDLKIFYGTKERVREAKLYARDVLIHCQSEFFI
jgi:hypothetical protein